MVGSLGGSLLSFPFPALLHLTLARPTRAQRILDICLISFGLLVTVVCTVTSIMNLVEVMGSSKE